MGAEGCVVGEWVKEVQFSLVEQGNCSVWVAACKGSVRGDWGLLLRCRYEFLTYAYAVGWVIHVFHDEDGELGWNWYSPLLYAVRSFV